MVFLWVTRNSCAAEIISQRTCEGLLLDAGEPKAIAVLLTWDRANPAAL